MTCGQQIDRRKRELALIHIAKSQLKMDDETYRNMLFTVARVHSAADLDAGGRAAVLDHLKASGFKPKKPANTRRNYPGRPHNINTGGRGPYLKKIEAFLADAGRPWSYARGIAKKMFHVDQLEFCTPGQLRKIVAALEYDARRREKNAS